MQKFRFNVCLFLLLIINLAMAQSFRFALITDTHIQMHNAQPDEDLMASVSEINSDSGIEFVLIAGDVSDRGDSASLLKAKEMLDKLKVPYYITFGNHDILTAPVEHKIYKDIFGSDKFAFMYKDVFFIGFTSCPEKQFGIGHIAQSDLEWVEKNLSKLEKTTPIIALTHYPLQKGDIDNWESAINTLQKFNIQAVLNGHYHRNALLMFNNLPGIVNRSNLRKNQAAGGYSIYEIDNAIKVSEKITGKEAVEWIQLPIEQKEYSTSNK